jgi:hypothetical protein
MSTPDLHLQTGFVLNAEGRITSTREPVTNQKKRADSPFVETTNLSGVKKLSETQTIERQRANKRD